jgi:hypothetical protein
MVGWVWQRKAYHFMVVRKQRERERERTERGLGQDDTASRGMSLSIYFF